MIIVTVQCNDCGQEESNPPPVRNAARAAREMGWTVNERTGRAVCDECLTRPDDVEER